MGEIYVASSQAIREVIDSLQQLNGRYQETSQDIVQEAKKLTQKWEGEASERFQETFNKEQHCFEDFYQGIMDYLKVLNNILERYERAEETNINIAAH